MVRDDWVQEVSDKPMHTPERVREIVTIREKLGFLITQTKPAAKGGDSGAGKGKTAKGSAGPGKTTRETLDLDPDDEGDAAGPVSRMPAEFGRTLGKRPCWSCNPGSPRCSLWTRQLMRICLQMKSMLLDMHGTKVTKQE